MPSAREAERAGARYLRRDVRGGAAAARNDGPRRGDARARRAASTPTACPQPGLARRRCSRTSPTRSRRRRAADRRARAGCDARRGARGVARRVALRGASARRSTAGPTPRAGRARRARAVRARRGARRPPPPALRRDARPRRRGRRPRPARAATSATSRPRRSRTSTAPTRARGSRRRVYYGRTAAPLAQAPPRQRAPAARLAVDDRRVGGRRRAPTADRARRSPPPRPRCSPARCRRGLAVELAALGTLQSGRVVADALTRTWWPLSRCGARATRSAAADRAAALVSTKAARCKLADDLAYGYGVWRGCLQHRTLAPLMPARPWRLVAPRHSEQYWTHFGRRSSKMGRHRGLG